MNGERFIDVGGAADEPDYMGEVLVICAWDPGVSTGWSLLKVPVRELAADTVARTLVRCRHSHGTVRRSVTPSLSPAGAAWDSTDSQHVTDMLKQAHSLYEEYMPEDDVVDCESCDGRGFHYVEVVSGVSARETVPCEECEGGGELIMPPDFDTEFVFVMEGFDLRMLSMDPSLLAPIRVASIFKDRLEQVESDVPVFFQKVSDAKHTITDTRLRSWGLYDSESGAHARDADRHAVLFLRNFASSVRLRRRVFGYDPLDF